MARVQRKSYTCTKASYQPYQQLLRSNFYTLKVVHLSDSEVAKPGTIVGSAVFNVLRVIGLFGFTLQVPCAMRLGMH